MSVRWLSAAALTAFAIALTLLIAQRLSGDALALMVGIVLGSVLSWPGYYFIFRLAHRATPSAAPQAAPPPVTLAPPLLSQPRQFVFVPDEQTSKPGLIILK